MTSWLDDVFAVRKPVIAMLHLAALPGDPGFDSAAGIRAVVDRARGELAALQEGGVDGVMISNEFSLPYLTKTEPITAITMARVIGELLPDFTVPYGVNVLWDGRASIDLAVATGAQWVREIFTGVYASDFGLWNTNVGEVARHRHRIGGDGVKLLFNIVPESAVYLADRDLASVTATTVFATKPDGICVSGLTAGASTDAQALQVVKNNAGAVPVFVNTGVRAHNAADQLSIADGAIVGTYFKEDGVFENRAVASRVTELMTVVKEFRQSL
ncbi:MULTISPECIES: BtpA/SgcQ family protein [unclassified Mycolicibacterium]|uniref:BtpA/SgcQ family protein n=1 Tax=unclassified Mycolicibacterium TaxID=2636767 RepID=UPI0012DEF7CE|nr:MULTISPECIES: BtpA/SgcQ family protein [unclassified Mycolicibacterium]MUL84509.1 BtpA/SgcQ family protein [Mycolicibacterium sp. CBMA 329]MUL88284.1 BtpA/SgcQ family protein [Mycolicibacterium sp. CBMA 331]MUL99267.1 BtpA/SgcQ family protein [Mycolicibacterium sp. CBMA 334]MUM28091.1 BtpA/SgcQ family protein [Mycolicibacterium sp. CBMA 295]MUM39931.1 BtpA/SgcQ family protein [Mycolicibacterium sp. CBMA 247]